MLQKALRNRLCHPDGSNRGYPLLLLLSVAVAVAVAVAAAAAVAVALVAWVCVFSLFSRTFQKVLA